MNPPSPTLDAPAAHPAPRIYDEPDILLEVIGLKKYFPVKKGFLSRVKGWVHAVDDVSFLVREGETLGLVGESGCGKTTVGRTIGRLYPPTDGKVLFRSQLLGRIVDLGELRAAELKTVRREIQIIYQDPFSSLNPRMRVGEILAEPFVIHGMGDRQERESRIDELLEAVGLRSGAKNRFPHEFSGGQRQRIGIARALALRPRLVIADEPVSALDVSVQAQILNLLEELQSSFGLTYVFVAHDLSVVEHISDRVTVMYLGKVVEQAPVSRLYRAPQHPYTEALLSAVPVPDPDFKVERIVLQGGIPSPMEPPPGCTFHPRCPYAKAEGRIARCQGEVPKLREVLPGQWVACHFAEDFNLRGIGSVEDESAEHRTAGGATNG